MLYGRKAKGYSEIKVIADLAAQVGRGPVLDALMQSDEFIEHWAEVLTEHLRAPRLGDKSLSSCYAPTGNTAAQGDALARWIRDRGPRERFESAAVFNMGDVVRSSLRLDDLSPVLIAHSFALVSRPLQGNMIKERQIQDDFLATFENVYLHRKTSCLICHNSSYSVTGRSSFWSRTHPIPGHFEEALLGSRTGPAFPQTLSTFLRWKDVVSSDPGSVAPWGLSGCGTFKPADFVDPELTVDDPNFRPDPANPEAPAPRIQLKPRLATKSGGIVSIFDVESELRRGFDILRASGILTRKVSPADVAYCQLCQACAGLPEAVVLTPEQQEAERKVLELLNGRCRQCHGRWTTPGGNITSEDLYERLIRSPALNRESCARVSPGDTAKSYFWEKIRAVSDGDENCSRKDSRMPADGGRYLDGTQEAVLRDWIAGLPVNAGCKACKQRRTDDCPNPGKRAIDPLESFAFMTSVTLVNRVWAEVMGYPLTIPNYFPRSQGQGQRLATLSETVFTTNKFSLKALLREVLVTAPHFNRAPPSRGGPVYEVPLVFDPWIERDPRVPPMANGWPPLPNPAYNPAAHPEHHANAMTEAVRRYPAHALIRSARTALGWPMRPLFFDIGGSSIIDRDLAADTGLFISDAEPGFRGMNLQSLLGWEDRMGACMRPDGVAIDWMDRLLAEIGRINAAAVSRRISRREAAATVKDWLVGDLGISDGAEAGALAVLLGWSSAGWTEQRFLDADVPSDAPGLATFAAGLRRFCGVLLQTPQFQFGGLAAAELTPPLADPSARDPRLRVCNPGPCQYRELCEVLAGPLRQNGWQVICPPPDPPSAVVAARSAPPSVLASAELDALCPRGRCYLMKLPPACSRARLPPVR